MRTLAWYLFLALLVAAIYGLGVYTGPELTKRFLPNRTGKPPTTSKEGRSALGRLQPSGSVINVVAQPGDRIDELFVKQGAHVEAGEKLVRLASFDDRTEELKLAKDQLDDARKQRASIVAAREARRTEFETQVKALESTAALEKKLQLAKVKALEGQVEIAKKQVTALVQLTPGIADVPREQMDKAKGALSQYELELGAARDSLDAIDTKLKDQLQAAASQRKAVEADFGFRSESVPLSTLAQQVKLAELRRDRSLIVAPKAGTVIKIANREGDTTGTEPVIQIAAGDGMVAIAEVYATDVRVLRDWLTRGAVTVEISSPALGEDKLTGKLTNPNDISQAVARNAITGFNPRADADRRVVEVRAAVDEKWAALARKFIGLDVTVEFKPAAKP